MNPTNVTSPSQICLAVWFWYIGNNDKSNRPHPYVFGLTSTTTLPSRCGTGLATSAVRDGTGSVALAIEGGIGSATSIVEGGTGETWRMRGWREWYVRWWIPSPTGKRRCSGMKRSTGLRSRWIFLTRGTRNLQNLLTLLPPHWCVLSNPHVP